jgi:hypothetical protein
MGKWRTSTTVGKHLVGFVPIESDVEAHVALWRLALDHRVTHRRQHLTTGLALTHLTLRTESGYLGVLATQLFGIKQTLVVLGRDQWLAVDTQLHLAQHQVEVLGLITHHEVAVVLVLADDVIGRGRARAQNRTSQRPMQCMVHQKAPCSARSPRPRAGCANLADQPRNSRWVPAQPTGTGDPCTQPSHSHGPHATGASPSTFACRMQCVQQHADCVRLTPNQPKHPPSIHVYRRGTNGYTNMLNNTRSTRRPQHKPNTPPHMHPRSHLGCMAGTVQNADAKLVNFYVCVNLCQFVSACVSSVVSQVVFEKQPWTCSSSLT